MRFQGIERNSKSAMVASRGNVSPNIRHIAKLFLKETGPAHKTKARHFSTIPSWATLDPKHLGIDIKPHFVGNIVNGEWQPETSIQKKLSIPNPMDKHSFPIASVADTSMAELNPFIKSMEALPKSGLHNPLKNVERYLMYGEISRQVRHKRKVARSENCRSYRFSYMRILIISKLNRLEKLYHVQMLKNSSLAAS